MISRAKCFITSSALFFATFAAFGNSTAFNGYVQTSGSTGLDLTSLDGGNYRVTVTRSGQLNFRYTIGDQTFDSNPEAARLDFIATSDTPRNDDNGPAGYTASITVTRLNPAQTWAPSFTSIFHLLSSPDPAQFLSNVSLEGVSGASNSGPQLAFQSDWVNLTGALTGGSTFDVSSLTPVTLQVPSTSFVSLVDGGGNFYYNANPVGILEEVPEPATFALLAGALLAGIARCLLLSRNRSC